MKNLDKVGKEIASLRLKIRQADYCYYVLSDPEISDKAYDDLLRDLKFLEKDNPQLITPDSPTQRVAQGISSGFKTVKHREKMLSLDNTYSIQELKEWEEKIKRMLKREVALDYVVEPKIDGVSCSLTYKNGAFLLGTTRGDGQAGEDVTPNLKTIKSIPLRLSKNYPQLLEVRGEVFMSKKDFAKINKERIESKETVFANPRNATSGSLKLLDSKLVAKRHLRCLVHSYGWVDDADFTNHKQFLKRISTWGLPIDFNSKHCQSIKQVIDYCLRWEKQRDSLDYEVDGIVVKVNSFSLRRQLGSTMKSPRWAVAYKFPAHQATTKIAKIEFGVGRTGIITPVAILEPIECGGVTISRATLHNFDEIQRLDIRNKDTVLIERAGEVIPKIIKVISSKRKGKEKKVLIPTKCPVCSGKVAKEAQVEVYLYCLNPDCPAQLKKSVLHFISRNALDIEGMGESVVAELVDRKIIKTLADIYLLKKEDLLSLPLFKEKRANNLIQAIIGSKQRSLSRLLYGLGIRHVGEKAAMLLADNFKNIDKLLLLKEEDLTAISEIGPTMALSIVNYFAQPQTKKMINLLKKLGISTKELNKPLLDNSFSGLTFIFTGELNSIARNQAKEIIQKKGAKVVSTVSKNTDFVVVGKNPGSKFSKAKALGVRIVYEDEFLKLIK